MNPEMSPNTKAILLLTAPLMMGGRRGGREGSVRPLTSTEYGKLARELRDCDLQPADLIGPGAGEILSECQIGLDQAQVTQLLRRGFQLSQALEHWTARTIWVLSHADPDYPGQFKRRLRGNAPPVIYGCGDRTLLESGGLAVVGSRDVSDELIEYAERIGRIAATAQSAIVSGGARGVDQAAMRGALIGGGTAVGVLADGLEKAVMHREHRDMLMDDRLALISPYDPRAGFSVGNAMRRNKLVYALADVGLVVNAAYNKGGTWAGAVEQLDKLRLVPMYARANGEGSKGLEALIRRGARSWPDPQTPDEFRLALSGKHQYSETESLWKTTLQPDPEDLIESSGSDIAGEIMPSTPQTGRADAGELPPGDALFAKVEELLASIDTPTTDSAVATHLQVSKSQAREWLKRLIIEGKYNRSTRPVRYDRIS